MKHLELYEAFTSKVTIGIDIDGTISNFTEAYNSLFKRYFPNNEINKDITDWFWYQKMKYDGADASKWMKAKKAETFDLAQPFPDAVNTINNIYDFVKTHGHTLNIVTNQITPEAKEKAKEWLDKYGFKFDDIVFVDMAKDKWKHVDIMVDDAPKVIDSKPLSKVSIKPEQPWNQNSTGDFNLPKIKDLTIDIMQRAIAKLRNTTTL